MVISLLKVHGSVLEQKLLFFPRHNGYGTLLYPKKISVTMWKALHDGLSLDDQVRSVGVPIVLRCNCCDASAYEDKNHVLSIGEFAEKI